MARIVFRNVNLLDGDNAAQSDMCVIVEGERVAYVGPDPAARVGGDDEIYDLAGATLLPGMTQGHFHSHFGPVAGAPAPCLGLEHSPPYLSMLAAANARTALHCGFTSAIGSSNAYAVDVALKEAILAGIVEGPRYLAGSMELVATGEMSDYANNRFHYMGLSNTGITRPCDGADAWRLATREQAGRGCDVIKISASPGHGSAPARDVCYLMQEELDACVGAARTLNRRIRAHVASRTGILACARSGVAILDHADMVDAECIDAILDNGAIVLPSMLWSVRFMQAADAWDWSQGMFPIGEGFPEDERTIRKRLDGVRKDFEHTCRMLPKLNEAGVVLVTGDDFGPEILPHGSYIDEFEVYTKDVGIPALDVIRWATKNGAKMMQMEDELGTVEEGKLADLVVVDGDPSVDIGNLREPRAVLKNGDFVRNELAAGLR